MGLLQDIQRRIRAKESEIHEIEQEIRSLITRQEAAKAYIAGLQDILPKVQKEEAGNGAGNGKQPEFRKGSMPEVVHKMLAKQGSPMHVDLMLDKIGKSGDKKAKLALVGTLARYARQGLGFKKTAPNTYALIGSEDAREGVEAELPAEFGR